MRTGGRLGTVERLGQTLWGLRALAAATGARLGRRLGLRPREVRLLLADLTVPHSPLVTAAERALEGAPAWLRAHSMRAYFWGALLGARDGLRFHPELLLVSALLHDLGLVHRSGAACFALRGARRSREVALQAGADPAFADELAEAIAMHLNVTVAGPSVEARLLRAGSGFDTAGERYHHVHRDSRRQVLAAWPREGFAHALCAVLHQEATMHADTRIGFLCHSLGFLRLVEKADRRFGADQG